MPWRNSNSGRCPWSQMSLALYIKVDSTEFSLDLPGVLEVIWSMFTQNDYSDIQNISALTPPCVEGSPKNVTLVTFLPFVGPSLNHISSLPLRHNIKTLGLPPRKIIVLLWPIKDYFSVRSPDIYSIPCECGKVYIWQDIPLKLGSRRTTGTLGCIIWRNQLWSRIWTWVIASTSITPVSWPTNLDVWNPTSGKWWASSWQQEQGRFLTDQVMEASSLNHEGIEGPL